MIDLVSPFCMEKVIWSVSVVAAVWVSPHTSETTLCPSFLPTNMAEFGLGSKSKVRGSIHSSRKSHPAEQINLGKHLKTKVLGSTSRGPFPKGLCLPCHAGHICSPTPYGARCKIGFGRRHLSPHQNIADASCYQSIFGWLTLSVKKRFSCLVWVLGAD